MWAAATRWTPINTPARHFDARERRGAGVDGRTRRGDAAARGVDWETFFFATGGARAYHPRASRAGRRGRRGQFWVDDQRVVSPDSKSSSKKPAQPAQKQPSPLWMQRISPAPPRTT